MLNQVYFFNNLLGWKNRLHSLVQLTMTRYIKARRGSPDNFTTLYIFFYLISNYRENQKKMVTLRNEFVKINQILFGPAKPAKVTSVARKKSLWKQFYCKSDFTDYITPTRKHVKLWNNEFTYCFVFFGYFQAWLKHFSNYALYPVYRG